MPIKKIDNIIENTKKTNTKNNNSMSGKKKTINGRNKNVSDTKKSKPKDKKATVKKTTVKKVSVKKVSVKKLVDKKITTNKKTTVPEKTLLDYIAPEKSDKVPKKRGRRPQKILSGESHEGIQDDNKPSDPSVTDGKNNKNSSLLVKLTINPEQLRKAIPPGKKNKTVGFFDTESSDSGAEISDTIFKNDIPSDTVCNGCNCERKDKIIAGLKAKLEKYNKKERSEKITKIYSNKIELVNISTSKKITLKKTKIRCWWDGHQFDNIPFFLPDYCHNGTYYVRGCFCSPNCALAYNLYVMKDSQIYSRQSLIYRLYRLLYGIDVSEQLELSTAGPFELLNDYGGEMSIEDFREKNKIGGKEYIKFVPPICPVGVYIQERSTDQTKNESGYVLERSAPPKKSVSSLNNYMKD